MNFDSNILDEKQKKQILREVQHISSAGNVFTRNGINYFLIFVITALLVVLMKFVSENTDTILTIICSISLLIGMLTEDFRGFKNFNRFKKEFTNYEYKYNLSVIENNLKINVKRFKVGCELNLEEIIELKDILSIFETRYFIYIYFKDFYFKHIDKKKSRIVIFNKKQLNDESKDTLDFLRKQKKYKNIKSLIKSYVKFLPELIVIIFCSFQIIHKYPNDEVFYYALAQYEKAWTYNYVKADKYITHSINITKKKGNKSREAFYYRFKADCYLKLHDVNNTLINLKKAKNIYKEINDKSSYITTKAYEEYIEEYKEKIKK